MYLVKGSVFDNAGLQSGNYPAGAAGSGLTALYLRTLADQ
jgi:hypothetical protein